MRFGDIIRNDWAGNRNPLKLTMFIRNSGQYLITAALDGREVKHYKKADRRSIVLTHDTPDLFARWAAMAKELTATCSGCAMCGPVCGSCEDRKPDDTKCEKCGRFQYARNICDGTGRVPSVPHE